MSDKAAGRKVAILIKRERTFMPKIIVATGFKFRPDKATGILEIHLATNTSLPGPRIGFDPFVLQSNTEELKRYTARMGFDADDAAQKEDISVVQEVTYANIIHFSQMGPRAETIFGLFSPSDWSEATRRKDTADMREIKSIDAVVAITTAEFQKKLILE